MAEPSTVAEANPSSGGKVKNWMKTAIGTLAGLFSGAVLMYLTPLLDRVVKPAKPVANFGYQADGLTVTFHNRSSGGSAGWWDFGDGSPLEPVTPQQEILTHTYARPGEYTVRLTLRNLIGEEHERTVVVRLEPPRIDPPSIAAFDIVPVSPGSYAPATFRIVSKVQNAQLYIWDLGDGRPLEISADKDGGQERLVTFERPGAYVVRLAAVNGTQAAVKSDIVQVNVPPVGTVTAVLSVTDEATRVETITVAEKFTAAFPVSSRETVHRIDKQLPARPGFEITDVGVKLSGGVGQRLQGRKEMVIDPAAVGARGVRELRLQLASDRRSVRLTGELVREGGKGSALPTLSLPVELVQQRRTPASRAGVPVTATLSVPGSAVLTMPPLPSDWTEPRRQARLELREGDRVVWQESQLTRGALLTLQNKRCIVSATAAGSQVRVDLVELPPGLIPTAN